MSGRIIDGFEWDAIRWLTTLSIVEALRWAEWPDESDDEEGK